MENALWFIFGVLAFLIAIGILVQLVANTTPESKESINTNAIRELGQWCRFVCNSDIETRLSKNIEIASGALVKSDGKNICIESPSWKRCAQCGCDVNGLYLDLNRPEILQMYKSHTFKCVFERGLWGVVTVECRG